jgi:signal transduction histidine kinase
MTSFLNWFRNFFESFIPLSLIQHAESARKARMIVSFGFLGGAFGFSYAAFYLLIGHYYGALIITLCSTAAVSVPWFLRFTGQLRIVGNLQALILTLGFFGLASVEGGVHGHAIAWLAGVPLCVLLLADKSSALIWCVICLVATSYFCVLELCGINLPLGYAERLHPLVTAVGFMGLTVFMSILGIIFENGREKAFASLKEAHADLSQANEELIRLNHEKDEFLGIAAHDLKNRIFNVRALAELISATSPQRVEQVKQDAEEIIHAAMRMQEAVGNLLAMDAIEAGRFQLTLQVCDLVELTHRVIRNHRSAATRKRVSIEFTPPPTPALIIGDVQATVQVLDNLLSNAIKYSPFEKRVVVEVSKQAGMCVFTIRDQGQGFSEQDKKHLFEKFSRLSALPTGGETSTGLGLSIVKKIVVAMGGSVRCESMAGSGASFIVSLPSGA